MVWGAEPELWAETFLFPTSLWCNKQELSPIHQPTDNGFKRCWKGYESHCTHTHTHGSLHTGNKGSAPGTGGCDPACSSGAGGVTIPGGVPEPWGYSTQGWAVGMVGVGLRIPGVFFKLSDSVS